MWTYLGICFRDVEGAEFFEQIRIRGSVGNGISESLQGSSKQYCTWKNEGRVLDVFEKPLLLEQKFPWKPGLAKNFSETRPPPFQKKKSSDQNLQDDREVVLAATSARGSSLVHASQRLRQERAVVLSAVSLGSQIEGGPPDCCLVFVGDAQ